MGATARALLDLADAATGVAAAPDARDYWPTSTGALIVSGLCAFLAAGVSTFQVLPSRARPPAASCGSLRARTFARSAGDAASIGRHTWRGRTRLRAAAVSLLTARRR